MGKIRFKERLLITIIFVLVLIIGIFVAFGKNDVDIEKYNPDNSYIILEEQLNSRVKNETEARKLLTKYELGDEYLLKDTFKLNDGKVYHFQETYEGIPVHGRYSNVIASGDTTALGIASNYYPVNVEISPKIDSDKALIFCQEYLDIENITDDTFVELCIYGFDENIKLSYCVYIGSESIYIDANTGEVIEIFNNMQNIECLLKSNLGEVEVTAEESIEGYELLDTSRGGGIESCILPADAGGVFDFRQKSRTRVVISPNDKDDFYSSVDAYYNIERVYDYYSGIHHFESTDGNNKRKIHIINNIEAYKNFNNNEKIVRFQNNAAATTLYNSDGELETWFIISKINNNAEFVYSYYLDVMAHEYTHAVMFSIIGNSKNDQMNAMGEAYSDIMGECCEAFYNIKSDWNILGTRNIADIANSEDVGTNINHIDEYSDELDAHDASTVISSAAYYMFMGVNEEGNYDSKYALHNYETLSKLWFTSMFYLTPSSDFLTCRYAVESVANLMLEEGMINEMQSQGIKNAFERVGIEGNAIEKHTDLLKALSDFELQIKDKQNRDYEECDVRVSRIYGGNDYNGHNLGIRYRLGRDGDIFDGSYEEYIQQKLEYEEGGIYCINLIDKNSLLEELFIFEITKRGTNELVLHTSFLGNDFNPFEAEQSNEETSINDEVQGGFVLDNPYPEGYQINKTAFDNLFSGHFANMSAPMGLELGETYEASKKFALKASYDMEDPINGAYYLMIVDVLGNVYDMIPVSKYPKVATGWLKDDVFYCSDGSSACIMKQGGDITDNFFEESVSLIDIVNDNNGIHFFTAETVFDSPYESKDSSTDVKYEVWDNLGNVILHFYKNELVNKYGIDSWVSKGSYHLQNIGNGIYHVSNRHNNNNSAQYIFIDINRQKAFAVPTKEDSQYETIESDGNYIMIPHHRTETVTIFDINSEQSVCIENVSEAYSLGEERFFTDKYCYSIQGDIMFGNEDLNSKDEIEQVSPYHDEQALVIFDCGKYYQSREHEYGIGLLNKNSDEADIITTLDAFEIFYSYVQEMDTYCIFTDEGYGGFLVNGNKFLKKSVYGSSELDCYYGVVDSGNQCILRYGHIGNDYPDEISVVGMYGYELFQIN